MASAVPSACLFLSPFRRCRPDGGRGAQLAAALERQQAASKVFSDLAELHQQAHLDDAGLDRHDSTRITFESKLAADNLVVELRHKVKESKPLSTRLRDAERRQRNATRDVARADAIRFPSGGS